MAIQPEETRPVIRHSALKREDWNKIKKTANKFNQQRLEIMHKKGHEGLTGWDDSDPVLVQSIATRAEQALELGVKHRDPRQLLHLANYAMILWYHSIPQDKKADLDGTLW